MGKQDAIPVGLVTRSSSVSPVVMPMDGRPRCERHQMLTLSGVQCARCMNEEATRHTARALFIVATVALGVLVTLVSARGFMMARELAASPASASSEQAPSADGSLVVYTTGGCPYCRKAKAWLDEHQIAYQEKNVDADDAARAEWEKLGGRSVPLFAIDGEVVQRGYEASGQNLTKVLHERGLR